MIPKRVKKLMTATTANTSSTKAAIMKTVRRLFAAICSYTRNLGTGGNGSLELDLRHLAVGGVLAS